MQITVAEQQASSDARDYYDKSGAPARTCCKNHMMQLLTLVAMEPPARSSRQPLRDEKVKYCAPCVRSRPDEIQANACARRYGAGTVEGQSSPAISMRPRSRKFDHGNLVAAKFSRQLALAGVPFYLAHRQNA